MFLTDGYPRFGTYDVGVAMFIDAAATTAEAALTQVEITFMQASAITVSLICVAAILVQSAF